MIDLYVVYKQYYQRWYRNKENLDYEEMKDISHDLVKNIYMFRNDKIKFEENRLLAIDIAEDLISKEKFLNTYTNFGKKLLKNLEDNTFEINVPYPVERRWNSINLLGEVYVLNSNQMTGCSKLGATTLDIDTRIKKYEYRYGYNVNLFYSLEIISPFYFEKYISDLIRDKRVTSKSNEHTNEWFFISPYELQEIIEKNIGVFLKKYIV